MDTTNIHYQLANISRIGTSMVKVRGDASFFKQIYTQTNIVYIYIYIYIYIYYTGGINIIIYKYTWRLTLS